MRRFIGALCFAGVLLGVPCATAGATTPDDEQWMLSYYNAHGNVSWARDSSGFLPSSMIIGNYHVLFLKSGLVFRIDGTTGVSYVSSNLTDPPSMWRLATLEEVVAAANDNASVVHAIAWDHPAIASMAFAPCVAKRFYEDLNATAYVTGMYFSNPRYAASLLWLQNQPGMALCVYAHDLRSIGLHFGWLSYPQPTDVGVPL